MAVVFGPLRPGFELRNGENVVLSGFPGYLESCCGKQIGWNVQPPRAGLKRFYGQQYPCLTLARVLDDVHLHKNSIPDLPNERFIGEKRDRLAFGKVNGHSKFLVEHAWFDVTRKESLLSNFHSLFCLSIDLHRR